MFQKLPNTTEAVVIAQLPGGDSGVHLAPAHFEVVSKELPEPAADEVLVQTILISIDAANRAWMQGATYRSALASGQVMDGLAIGRVLSAGANASTAAGDNLAAGDLVEGDLGWCQYSVKKARHLSKHSSPPSPLSHLLSALGVAGKTAWHGLFSVGKVQPGQTVLVSAAAGSVGTLVGQMAKLHGCRVVGIAGGAQKCAWVKDELGFDDAVDYKAETKLLKAIAAACPDGVDLYFDNVGGAVLEAALFAMNNRGVVVCCGAVSQYDTDRPMSPRGLPGLLVVKRLRMEGFVVMDHSAQDERCVRQISGWLESGELRVPEDIVEGLDNCPAALIGLLAGENKGKRLVRISADAL